MMNFNTNSHDNYINSNSNTSQAPQITPVSKEVFCHRSILSSNSASTHCNSCLHSLAPEKNHSAPTQKNSQTQMITHQLMMIALTKTQQTHAASRKTHRYPQSLWMIAQSSLQKEFFEWQKRPSRSLPLSP